MGGAVTVQELIDVLSTLPPKPFHRCVEVAASG